MYGKKLSVREQEVWDFINSYTKLNGEAPTQKEIGDGLGFTGGRAAQYLDLVEAKGRLNRGRGHRNIKLVAEDEI
jgi:SOS-response transcriptional repressor LexA